jgi:hypothetical protein
VSHPQLIGYRFNDAPRRSLALTGVVLAKAVLVIPHLIMVTVLETLGLFAAYIGYFFVAFTGRLPSGLQNLVAMSGRWWTRTWGWYSGVSDVYPPFEPDPDGYLPDVELPRAESPSRAWAVAGIFGIKLVAALPHLILLLLLGIGTILAAWAGFVWVAITATFPIQFQDFHIGTTQWQMRVVSWIAGLTDAYPPFDLEVHPTAE